MYERRAQINHHLSFTFSADGGMLRGVKRVLGAAKSRCNEVPCWAQKLLVTEIAGTVWAGVAVDLAGSRVVLKLTAKARNDVVMMMMVQTRRTPPTMDCGLAS